MTQHARSPALTGGVGLLERAVTYLLGSLRVATPEYLPCATPCAHWTLRELLEHLDDSMAALLEAVSEKAVALDVDTGEHDDPVSALRWRAGALLGAWVNTTDRDPVAIGGCPISASIVCAAGAIEIGVHGWDVARACGDSRPLPEEFAAELLDLAPLLVSDDERRGRFAAAVRPPPDASPSQRLLAFLGRGP